VNFGSVCSGIEAASVALSPLGFKAEWFSEIADFPSKVLAHHYPNTPNLGDMNELPQKILRKEVLAPDFFCGGTPCQAFSLAGLRDGLDDHRGQLTLKFVEIANAIDDVRKSENKDTTVILWENVDGVLTDKTNAFGCFLAGLVGYDSPINSNGRWPSAGVVVGPRRHAAWRVLDAKYFGLPQQRKRVFVIASGGHIRAEQILFESPGLPRDIEKKRTNGNKNERATKKTYGTEQLDFFESLDCPKEDVKEPSISVIDGQKIELFRDYTDCLYSAYGTKWNGNAAAYNGSLYISQNDKVRRLTPLECERLMGFPDNYTDLPNSTATARYQAVGNSWAVPVIKWIGERLLSIHR